MQNDQAVPAGIPTGQQYSGAATPGPQQAPAQAPQQPAPQYAPQPQHQPYHQYQQPQAPQVPNQHLEQPQQPPVSPFSKAAYEPAPQEPQQPAAPKQEVESKDKPEPTYDKNLDALIGDLKSDTYLAPGITYIENMCAGKVDLERAFGNAAKRGDPSLIDEAYLKEVLGDDAGTVASQARSLFQASSEKHTRTMQGIYTEFGGEDSVRQMGSYFNEKADPAAKAAIKQMLDSGNPDLIKYGVSQIKQFAESAGMTMQKHAQPLGGASSRQGMSRKEYQEAISAERNITPERYDELRELRRLGQSQGR